jgi:signal transduction histidine kinase
VLLNVVGNAIKFTMPGGHVDVELEQLDIKTPVGRRMYELRVIDNGVGISEDFMEHIYEPFSRERTSTISGLPGTGLGLSITKNIVDMMDGTIDITSEKGKGTTIKIDFELELQKSEAEARDKAPKYTAPAKPLLNEKILVVEDHDLNSEIVAEILG